ncbi:FAD binding domain-containing protein [Sphingobium faniae]|nr:FAD binding domain-containing protein [Sphingobium faniae]
MGDDVLEVDLLIAGGGMAGMVAAAYAAERGQVVLVVEKQAGIGGSALISGGGLWTAADYETMRRVNPLGEDAKAHIVLDNFDAVGDFIASLGTMIEERAPYIGTQSFDGIVRRLDVADFMKRARSSIQAAGGFVVTQSTIASLFREGGRVTGGRVSGPDGDVDVRARYTLLATGGFQNDPELRAAHITPAARHAAVRSNPASDGQGLRLALEAGASTSERMGGFYGHTIPYPIDLPMEHQDYIPFAQFYLSPRAILLDEKGRRFTDESRGYYLNAQEVLELPRGRALLIFDQTLREDDTERFGVDRFDFARRRGAHVASASTAGALKLAVASWGYANVADAIAGYNAALQHDSPLDPPRNANRRPLEGELFAIEVQPAITFTHGGIRTDEKAQVLDRQGQVIEGLLAAGADVGGTYYRAYAGGLAMASTAGLVAARTALGEARQRRAAPAGPI